MGIELLPGDSGAIRAAAGDVASAVPRLRAAHVAAVQVEEVLGGDHWQGQAFDAFREVVERKPLPHALDVAVDRMGRAIEELDRFAIRFDEHQERLRHLQAQAAAVSASLSGEVDPAEAAAAATHLRALEDQAHAVHDEHRRSLDTLAEVFDWLDDETTFAQPPPSNWDRMTGAVGDAAGGLWDVASSFGIGVWEGFRDLFLGIRDLLLLLDPRGWPELWAQRGQLVAILQYAWDNPVEFLGDLGAALLDLDTLFSDPARWLGRRVPDLLLALATVGAGTVAARAGASVRTLQGPLARAALRAADLPVRTPGEQLRRADGIAGRYVRIGADDAQLGRTGSGAFTRTDTVLGRLATRADSLGRAVQTGRQVPGAALGEIRTVTDLPLNRALDQLPMSARMRDTVTPWAGRSFGSFVTNGFTGRLAMVDGLLVGHAALSSTAYASLATVTGVRVLDQVAGAVGFGQAVVDAGTPEPAR